MQLSSVVREIAEVIGRDRALYLIGKLPRCHAGVEGKKSWRVILYVPKVAKLSPKHRLVEILGMTDAENLCRAFGGEILQPGNCTGIYRPWRDSGIAKLARKGVPNKTLAEWFGISERQVRLAKAV